MANYIAGQGDGLICNKCRMGAYELFRTETDTDYNGKICLTEYYRCRHCGNIWKFDVYREN